VIPGPVIETPRLILRPHVIEDFEACCFLASDRDAQHLIPHRPLTREEVWQRLLGMLGHWQVMDFGLLLVEERVSGQVVGEVGYAQSLRGLGPDFDPWPELSWMMTSDTHGRGYPTEAAQAMQQWLDDNFTIERTVCMVDPHFAAQRHTAERLGFHVFGHDEYKGRRVTKLRRILAHA
jgi:RimJ/RimL family protein N-acetyltransferase